MRAWGYYDKLIDLHQLCISSDSEYTKKHQKKIDAAIKAHEQKHEQK